MGETASLTAFLTMARSESVSESSQPSAQATQSQRCGSLAGTLSDNFIHLQIRSQESSQISKLDTIREGSGQMPRLASGFDVPLGTQDFATPDQRPQTQLWDDGVSPRHGIGKRKRNIHKGLVFSQECSQDDSIIGSQASQDWLQKGRMKPPPPSPKQRRPPNPIKNMFVRQHRAEGEEEKASLGVQEYAECSKRAMPRSRLEWQVGNTLGRGSFSTVFQATHRLEGADYALKKSHPFYKGNDMVGWIKEVQAWQASTRGPQGPHAHMVHYYGAWVEPHPTEETTVGFIQLELCGSSVADMASSGPISETEMWDILRQVSKALQHLHSLGIAHLDVKPDNIFLARGKEGHYKLGDLGRAVPTDGSAAVEEGDTRYLPDELLRGERDHLDRCDMFSLGMSLYELALGHPLSETGHARDDIRANKLHLFPHISNNLQQVMRSLLRKDPLKRPTASEMVTAHIASPSTASTSSCITSHTKSPSMGRLPLQPSQLANCKENLH